MQDPAAEFHRRAFAQDLLNEQLWWSAPLGTDQDEWRGFFCLLCHGKAICYDALVAHVNHLVRGACPLLNWYDIKEWIEEGDRQLVWARVSLMIRKHDTWATKRRRKNAEKKKKRGTRDAVFLAISAALAAPTT